MRPEQERFTRELLETVEQWLNTPRSEGGPYKSEVRSLRLFLQDWRRAPFEEFEGASWMKIQGQDNPFQYSGIELPDSLDELTHQTPERKFLYLYFFLVKKKGYELRLHSTVIVGRVHTLEPFTGSSPSALYIKVR